MIEWLHVGIDVPGILKRRLRKNCAGPGGKPNRTVHGAHILLIVESEPDLYVLGGSNDDRRAQRGIIVGAIDVTAIVTVGAVAFALGAYVTCEVHGRNFSETVSQVGVAGCGLIVAVTQLNGTTGRRRWVACDYRNKPTGRVSSEQSALRPFEDFNLLY